MNKTQAQWWVGAITELLTGKDLVTVAIGGLRRSPKVLTGQRFKEAYIVEYADSTCSLGVSDSYGVMSGAEKWEIDANQRMIHAETTNGFGEPLTFLWVVNVNDGGADYDKWRALMQESWRMNAGEPAKDEPC